MYDVRGCLKWPQFCKIDVPTGKKCYGPHIPYFYHLALQIPEIDTPLIMLIMAKTELQVAMDFTQNKYSAPRTIEKMKILGAFWNYQLNNNVISAKLVKSAVLFSWQLQNGPQDLNFFNYPGYQIFIICEIHCYLRPSIFWV